MKLAGRSAFRSAAFAHSALFDRKRGKAFFKRADGKVTVSAGNVRLVARVFRPSERYVHSARMSLKADRDRHLALRAFRHQKVRRHEIALLAPEGKPRLVIGFFVLFILDQKRVVLRRSRHSQKLNELFARVLLPFFKVAAAVAHRGLCRPDQAKCVLRRILVSLHIHSPVIFVNCLHYIISVCNMPLIFCF